MKEILIALRNYLIRILYKTIIKPVLFLADPERVHEKTLNLCRVFGRYAFLRGLISFLFFYSNSVLEQEIRGIKFSNPVGLAAGFDKDGILTDVLPSLGFGFAEIGSITGEMCRGNPKPRLWRLKKSKSLVVYYGLKNKGCEKISQKLKDKKFKIPIGTSIAKSNSKGTVRIESGIKDYSKAFKAFTKIGDYFTVNISCPNAFGGKPFKDPKKLDRLLGELDKVETNKPVFLKISPDLSGSEVDSIISVSKSHRVDGFVCSNLTENRKSKMIIDKNVPESGGISGKVVKDFSDNLISHVYKKTKGKFIIIGCGGVSSAKDAYKKIRLGANLIQLITGMIFEGPQVISEINQGLAHLAKKDGFFNVSQAVGIDAR